MLRSPTSQRSPAEVPEPDGVLAGVKKFLLDADGSKFLEQAIDGGQIVGGRGGIRTLDPLLAKRGTEFIKSCRSRRNPLETGKL